ncbi:DUF2249 domain-containing protein [Devosia submarina]|uniref:DUF2249 domain-containing protein n=1 Tax=Devosia submarina TaxID=1173082 RepID=UPI000D36788D|nr:DUF2249 domain-containing protein [Devosia submarina]
MCSHCDRSDVVIDVPAIIPRMRHATIFTAFKALPEGEAFVIVNDHDPMPLWHLFNFRYSGEFEWNYELRGPLSWRVRVRRLSPPAVDGAKPDA